jgi:hypothetical protein
MYPLHLSNYVIRESQTSLEALFMLNKQLTFLPSQILVVINENDEYIGIITQGALRNDIMHLDNPMQLTASDVCNRNATVLHKSKNNRVEAMAVFADIDFIWAIPVIDNAKNLTDIIFRQQVFYLDCYKGNIKFGNLPRMHYAQQIFQAAQLAKDLCYDSFSVIEFGVAGGNGLLNCEFHVKEIERLFGLRIDLYGFDTGEGLPKPCDYRDPSYIWDTGFFKMDIEKLQKRLQFAKLVIGDIRNTASVFMKNENLAPIGVMLIDVDHYSSTVPILDMLYDSPDKFLPRVLMYFDDIGEYMEHTGEKLAIKEFNDKSHDVKISQRILFGCDAANPQLEGRMHCAHFYKHKKYTTNKNTNNPKYLIAGSLK